MHPLRPLIGLGLVGYGLIVVLQIVAHEAFVAGILSLILGTVLLATGVPSIDIRRWTLVAALGAAAAGGVIGYNLATGSGLSVPEWGLLLYGVALLMAARWLDRPIGFRNIRIGTLVGWSFPLLLAPLLLFAIDAIVSGPSGQDIGQFADPLIHTTLVTPMAGGLDLFGSPTKVIGNNIVLQTNQGTLTLGVGLVCAGFYPMVLFMGILALHAWKERLAPRRALWYLLSGAIGLWLSNLFRLILLAKVGQRWGGDVLQTAHAHLGWLLFVGTMAVFWAVVLRKVDSEVSEEQPVPVDDPQTDPTRAG